MEAQKDGYFKSAVRIFECRFPGATGIFPFDKAPSHWKYPPYYLNPTNMNVYPGEKLNQEGHDLGWENMYFVTAIPDIRFKRLAYQMIDATEPIFT